MRKRYSFIDRFLVWIIIVIILILFFVVNSIIK